MSWRLAGARVSILLVASKAQQGTQGREEREEEEGSICLCLRVSACQGIGAAVTCFALRGFAFKTREGRYPTSGRRMSVPWSFEFSLSAVVPLPAVNLAGWLACLSVCLLAWPCLYVCFKMSLSRAGMSVSSCPLAGKSVRHQTVISSSLLVSISVYLSISVSLCLSLSFCLPVFLSPRLCLCPPPHPLSLPL